MTRRFRQMQPEERVTLAALLLQGHTLRHIGRVLGRNPGSLSRELARNTTDVGYASRPAQAASEQRREQARPRAKLDPWGPLWPIVAHMLTQLWSPQQIARTLRRQWPDNPELHVSHETIYNAIYAYPKGDLRKQLIACSPRQNSCRLHRSRPQGAAMKDGLGTIRTGIQGQGGRQAAAA